MSHQAHAPGCNCRENGVDSGMYDVGYRDTAACYCADCGDRVDQRLDDFDDDFDDDDAFDGGGDCLFSSRIPEYARDWLYESMEHAAYDDADFFAGS